jgi:hypothetical protein
MKHLLFLPLAWTFLTASAQSDDLAAPKPLPGRGYQVLLYVTGSSRMLEYSDVVRVCGLDDEGIKFETLDGFIVVHRGPYTLVGPKTDAGERTVSALHSPSGNRIRFYEAK